MNNATEAGPNEKPRKATRTMTMHATTHSNEQPPTNQVPAQGNPHTPRGLNPLQREYLLKPLDAGRVRQVQGMAHLEAWDVRRWATRVFGIGGWSYDTHTELIHQAETKTRGGREAWMVVYRAKVRLEIRDPHGNYLTHFEEYAAGDATLPSLGDAHDMALKTAESQALKRTLVNLGDTFGLSLYDGGGHLTEDATGRKVVRVAVGAHLDNRGTPAPAQDAPVQGEPDPTRAAA